VKTTRIHDLHIPRLDLDFKGIDPAIVRAALDQLPAQLGSELRIESEPLPAQDAPLRVSARPDATALARSLAQRIAQQVSVQQASRGKGG
jgi:hypothetical protein